MPKKRRRIRRQKTLRWLVHGAPMPKGWRRAEQALCSHNRWGVWIERKGRAMRQGKPRKL